jgi:hypothetical protein
MMRPFLAVEVHHVPVKVRISCEGNWNGANTPDSADQVRVDQRAMLGSGPMAAAAVPMPATMKARRVSLIG